MHLCQSCEHMHLSCEEQGLKQSSRYGLRQCFSWCNLVSLNDKKLMESGYLMLLPLSRISEILSFYDIHHTLNNFPLQSIQGQLRGSNLTNNNYGLYLVLSTKYLCPNGGFFRAVHPAQETEVHRICFTGLIRASKLTLQQLHCVHMTLEIVFIRPQLRNPL